MVQGPAISASITMLVPDAGRDRANALLMVVGPMAQMLAPVLGGMLYAWIGVAGVIFIDLLTFVAAAIVVAFLVDIPQPPANTDDGPTLSRWRKITAGFRFLWAKDMRPLLYLSGYFLYLNFVTEGVWRLMPAYLLIRTDYNEPLMGVLLGISSAGLIMGGFIPIVWKPPYRRVTMLLGSLGAGGAALMLFALAGSIPLMAVLLFVLMLPYKFGNTLVSSIQQAKVPPELQGRVFALLSQVSLFAIPTALLITGPLVDGVLEANAAREGDGIALYILVCGGLLLAGSVVTWLNPRVRNLETELPDHNVEGG